MARHSFTRPAYVIRTPAPELTEFSSQCNMVLREIRRAGAAGITTAELNLFLHGTGGRSYLASECTTSLVARSLIVERDGRWYAVEPVTGAES